MHEKHGVVGVVVRVQFEHTRQYIHSAVPTDKGGLLFYTELAVEPSNNKYTN